MILSESRQYVKPIYCVMVKKIRRKVKKIAMKASLVALELEEIIEENQENQRKLASDFAKEFEFIDWKRKQNQTKEALVSDINTNEAEQQTPSEIKKIYRAIAIKTHPDKIDDTTLNEHFRDAVTAVEKEDWMSLIRIAGELSIDMDFISDETCELIEKSIVKSSKEIQKVKNSFSYLWSKQKTEKDKQIFTALFYQQHGINKEEFTKWLNDSEDT